MKDLIIFAVTLVGSYQPAQRQQVGLDHKPDRLPAYCEVMQQDMNRPLIGICYDFNKQPVYYGSLYVIWET